MRDPWGLNERAFARWYPIVCGLAERAGQREVRAELVGRATGRTLEIGAGSGLNLPHYGPEVTELVVSEPSEHMHEHLRRVLAESPPAVGSWQLVTAGAERLPFDDASFDTVVATYVHCTIADPAAALAEIARVLRPGGQYLFFEHVRSPDSRAVAAVQDVLAVPHTYIAAGCHPNRRMEDLLADSPLTVRRIVRERMRRAPLTVRTTVRGVATV